MLIGLFVYMQGVRGFPGLPGHPGLKGQKVSQIVDKYQCMLPDQINIIILSCKKHEKLTCVNLQQGHVGLLGPRGESGAVGTKVRICHLIL